MGRLSGHHDDFIFVSHANADKKRLKPLVQAILENSRLKLWVDNPAKMGFDNAYVRRHFYRLHPTLSWREQIVDALEQSMLVLALGSSRFWERYAYRGKHGKEDSIVHTEVETALDAKKLFLAHIEPIKISKLETHLQTQQIADACCFDEHGAALADVDVFDRVGELIDSIEDFRQRMLQSSLENGASQSTRDDFTPYLINRASQVSLAEDTILEASQGRVEPVFFMGSKSDCVDKFVERLRRDVAPKMLKDSKKDWTETAVQWPDKPARSFASDYRKGLAAGIDLGPTVLQAPLTGKLLERLETTVLAPISLVSMKNWNTTQAQHVRDWLAFWADFSQINPTVSAMPVLAVELLDPKSPDWKHWPKVRHRDVTPESIQADIEAVRTEAARDPHMAALTTLEILRPVTSGDVDNWILNIVKPSRPSERQEIEKRAKGLFGGVIFKTNNLPLAKFAEGMSSHFEG